MLLLTDHGAVHIYMSVGVTFETLGISPSGWQAAGKRSIFLEFFAGEELLQY